MPPVLFFYDLFIIQRKFQSENFYIAAAFVEFDVDKIIVSYDTRRNDKIPRFVESIKSVVRNCWKQFAVFVGFRERNAVKFYRNGRRMTAFIFAQKS